MNDQTVASALGTSCGAEQSFQWGQIKSRQVWRHFSLRAQMSPRWKHSHITQTVTVKSFISPRTFAPGSRSPRALSGSGWFHVLPLLSSNPSSSGLSLPANHTSLIYALSLPGSPSLLSPLTLPHPPFSLYCSVSSSILILINPPFPFPAPSSSLSCRTSCWAQCRVILLFSLTLSLSLGQHFRDLLIGLELSIPTGWITEHGCKSALA